MHPLLKEYLSDKINCPVASFNEGVLSFQVEAR